MLFKDLYTVEKVDENDNSIFATIRFNANHEIFNGHFPKQPVVPGVIQIQVIKELLEANLNTKLFMNNIIQIKYISPIVPDNNTAISVVILKKNTDKESIRIDANIGIQKLITTKTKLEFCNR